MEYLMINGQDFSPLVASLKVGHETLVSEDSGRNANGDTVLDVVNQKYKIYVGLNYTTAEEMSGFLTAIEDYVVEVTFLNPITQDYTSIVAYTGTPEPEYFTIQEDKVLCKAMELNFIEL